MIVTANRVPKDWYPLLPNPVIAESALDRLVSCTRVITLTGKSYRALLRPDKDLAIENAFAESFIGRLRDECLNSNWFISLKHARDVIEAWRKDCNEARPHSSL